MIKFDKYLPAERLKPFVKYYAVSEQPQQKEYKVFPTPGLVIGFQYRGQISVINDQTEKKLTSAGVTGIPDRFRIFKNSDKTGTILVYFTEIGFTHFTTNPACELFKLNISLDNFFERDRLAEVEERLALSTADNQRLKVIDQFLLTQLKDKQMDRLIVEAVKLIYESQGALRIEQLCEKLCISQSAMENRFKKVVGTTPKKFASIIRFNKVLGSMNIAKSLTEICYENNYFDQAHFIKDFKHYTGDAPTNFKRVLKNDDFLQFPGS